LSELDSIAYVHFLSFRFDSFLSDVIKDGVFYGRYWGCLPEEEVKNLHFETCYWSAIEYCIDNGLKRMEPGAGGGDYKWARGFDPELIHSVHYISHPGLRRAVGEFLEFETENNVELTEYLTQKSAVGSIKASQNTNNKPS
jgi:predicted N-acyltransferase